MNLDNQYLIAWLPFNTSPTYDAKGNTWEAVRNPTIGKTNAFNGKALQLDGQSFLRLREVMLGGQDFYIDGWVYVDSSSPDYARVLIIGNSKTKIPMVSVHKSPTDGTKLEIWVNKYADVSQDSGYTHTSTINSVGERVHFKLLYRYSTNRGMYLYINDQLAASGTGTDCPQFERQTCIIVVGAWSVGAQQMIGSLDELRIYDGTYLASGNGTSPTLDEYRGIIQSFDVERFVSTYIFFKPEMYMSFIPAGGAGADVDETYDAERRLAVTEQETYDVLRIVTQPVEVAEVFDTERRLANAVQITGDVSRVVLNGVTLIADVSRNVANVYDTRFDAVRRIKNLTKVFFDVVRTALNSVDFIADVERKILSATTGQRMLSRISPIYDESTFMKNFFQAVGVEWDKVRRYFITLREQRFIHTVTWGIEYLEHKYSVVPDRTLTLEERRARLGLKSFKKYPLNPAVLEKFARDNFGLEVYLDESDAGYIWMFVTNFTKAGFKGYMKHLLREKPAHLALAVLLYMTLYIGRERDDGLPKLYAGIVEMLTGSATIGLPKPKNQRMNIYAGVVQCWRGSITIGSKTKPFEHSY